MVMQMLRALVVLNDPVFGAIPPKECLGPTLLPSRFHKFLRGLQPVQIKMPDHSQGSVIGLDQGKVGLGTSISAPASARINPRANTLFPAPKFPSSRKTSPGLDSRPIRAARAIVSSSLVVSKTSMNSYSIGGGKITPDFVFSLLWTLDKSLALPQIRGINRP